MRAQDVDDVTKAAEQHLKVVDGSIEAHESRLKILRTLKTALEQSIQSGPRVAYNGSGKPVADTLRTAMAAADAEEARP